MGVEFGLANCTTKRQWTIDESHSRVISFGEMQHSSRRARWDTAAPYEIG